MEGRYKNQFCYEIFGFPEKCFLNEVFFMYIGLFCTYFILILDKIGLSVSELWEYCVTVS